MIDLEILSAFDVFVVNQDVQLRLRITNRTSQAIQIPDPSSVSSSTPTYSLWLPQASDPLEFNNTTAPAVTAPRAPVPPKLLTIEAGAQHIYVFSLNFLAKLDRIGSYRLSLSLDWQGMAAQSNELVFRITQAIPTSVSLGVGNDPDRATGEGAFFHSSNNALRLHLFQYVETHPAIDEAEVDDPVPFVEVGEKARDLRVPWTSDPFFAAMSRFFIWREGSFVKIVSDSVEVPGVVDLGTEPAALVRPALHVPDGPIEVLALRPSRDSLALVRFTPGGFADSPSGEIAWEVDLPGAVTAVSAGLAPRSLGNIRHVVATRSDEAGVHVFHSTYDAERPLSEFRGVQISTVDLIDNATPAILVSPDGWAEISVLAQPIDQPNEVALVQARFGVDTSEPGQSEVISLGSTGGPVTGGSLIYAHDNGILKRLDLVVQSEDGRLFKRGADGRLREVLVQGPATTPIFLAPGRNSSYILYQSPEGKFYLEAL